MRILFLVEHFPCISETFVLNQVTGLLDLGHEVSIYALGRPVAPVAHQEVERYRLLERTWASPEVPRARGKRAVAALRALPPILRRCGWRGLHVFDVARHGRGVLNLAPVFSVRPWLDVRQAFDQVHCHFGDKGLRALLWQDMGLFTCPFSVVFHAHELAGLNEAEGRARYGRLFASSALLLPISERWRQRLIGWGARAERVQVHHMGVDLQKFPFAPVCPEADARLRILSVGRLVEQKGFAYAIRAFAHMRRALPERSLTYEIIGGGELEAPLRALAEQEGVSREVLFTGPQPHDVILQRMREAHVFLLPSVTAANGFQEGIPVALMEAMASGLPVVSTRHSGIPELIDDGVSGYLAEEKAVEPLADAMARLVTDRACRSAISREARQKIERAFDIRSLNARLVELFRLEQGRS